MNNKAFKYFSSLILIIFSVFFLSINSALAGDYFIMPEVLGLSKKEAINKINAACGDINVTLYSNKIHDESLPNGAVRTIKPAAGSKIKSGTKLYMTIAENNLNPTLTKNIPDTTKDYSGTFVMPNVTGLTEQQAKDKLNAVSGNIPVFLHVSKVPSDKASNGVVIKVKPDVGSKVKSGAMLVLDVAENDFTAETLKTYPNVINMSADKAKKTLMNAGFPEYKISYKYNENHTKGLADNTVIDSLINANGNIKLTVYKNNLVSMPSVKGKSYAEAERILKNTGYFKQIKREEVIYSEDFLKKYPSRAKEINAIVKQFPSAGARINPDAGGYAYISEGVTEANKEITVPNISMVKEKDAVSKLKYYGLIPKITYKDSTSKALGGMTSVKCSPMVGSKVKKGTEIAFTVFRQKVKVPFLFNYTKEEAIKLLEDNGLKYEFVNESTYYSDKEGKVASSIPEKHTVVDPGTVVKVIIYKNDQVKIPNLAGRTKQDAIDYLKKYKQGLKYKFIADKTTVYETKADKIYKINPEYKTIVNIGDTLNLHTYKLLESVPNLIGKTEEQATKELEALEFYVKTVYEAKWDEKQKVGTVIKQSQKAGSVVSSPTFLIYVVREPDKVKIPNVIGKLTDTAKRTLMLADFSFKTVVKTVKVFDRKKVGKVVSTNPGVNTKVKPGSTVTLFVGELVDSVPNLVGLTRAEANKRLLNSGFHSTILYTDKGSPGKIVNQYPNANATPTSGKLNLYMAKPNVKYNMPTQQETDYIVPYVKTLTVNEARQRLAEVNLNYKINYVPVGWDRHGRVLGINPPPGVKLTPNLRKYVVLTVGQHPYSVPNLIGMTRDHALKVIENNRMYPRVKDTRPPANWDRRKQPIVLNQSPNPGDRKQGSRIEITLAYEAFVPNIEGKSLAEAVTRLQDWQLKYKIEFVPVSEGKYDRMVMNTNPYPGDKVPFGTTINLKVGKIFDGVPNVIGKSEKEAESILKNLNIYVMKEYKDSSKSNNVVIAQSQIPGTSRNQGSITIVLGTQASLNSITTPTPEPKRIKPPKVMASIQAAPKKVLSQGAPAKSQPAIIMKFTQEEQEKIKDLYRGIKEAYQNQNEYKIIDSLSDNWDSGDETDIMDLEDNLRNMFSVYDDISYSISGFNISKAWTNKFIVKYDVTITGQIYDMGVKREEKSSVSEEVIFDGENYKINKTLNGTFWYRQ